MKKRNSLSILAVITAACALSIVQAFAILAASGRQQTKNMLLFTTQPGLCRDSNEFGQFKFALRQMEPNSAAFRLYWRSFCTKCKPTVNSNKIITKEDAAAAIAGNSAFIHAEGGFVYTDPVDFDQFWNDIIQNGNESAALRYCDPSEMGFLCYDGTKRSARTSIPEYKTEALAARATYINFWLAENVPQIIPDGIRREDAIRLAYDWLTDNIRYNEAALDSAESTWDYQGSYHAFQSRDGICSTYTKAFRAILESVPLFDGIVDWDRANSSEPGRIRVASVFNAPPLEATHQWAAIQDDNGRWYHYDLAMQNKENIKDSDGNPWFYHMLDINSLIHGTESTQVYLR